MMTFSQTVQATARKLMEGPAWCRGSYAKHKATAKTVMQSDAPGEHVPESLWLPVAEYVWVHGVENVGA
jgi:hypothetical protein